MIEKENPPYAPNLVESMRSIGYSFETALADIVDNSIAAESTKVEILSICRSSSSFLSILDNGNGMDKEELFLAMKYGSYNPNDIRKKNDMGRFGLGLKSASLSQCRKLTVISKKNGCINGYRWDLDYIIKKGDWILQELEIGDIEAVFESTGLDMITNGTIVLWENFDRIEHTVSDFDNYLKDLLVKAVDHFSLIYHRLIGPKLRIYVNGNEIVARDPFLENNKATQLKREQVINIDGKKILVKPYILPHLNKLSIEDVKKVGGKESLRTEQGFYIYRNKRLIIYGTWFRLGAKNELTKLARIKVDIPNDMDYLWDIDIKKSRATLPNKLKYNLYNAVLESCGISEQVHVYRGKKSINDDYIRMWDVIEKRKGESLGLEVNLENPLIRTFSDSLDNAQKKVFFSLMDEIESTIPIEYIYAQVAKGNNNIEEKNSQEIQNIVSEVKERMTEYSLLGLDPNEFIDILIQTEKYGKDTRIVEELLKLKES